MEDSACSGKRSASLLYPNLLGVNVLIHLLHAAPRAGTASASYFSTKT
jgi:hypothetical protein